MVTGNGDERGGWRGEYGISILRRQLPSRSLPSRSFIGIYLKFSHLQRSIRTNTKSTKIYRQNYNIYVTMDHYRDARVNTINLTLITTMIPGMSSIQKLSQFPFVIFPQFIIALSSLKFSSQFKMFVIAIA